MRQKKTICAVCAAQARTAERRKPVLLYAPFAIVVSAYLMAAALGSTEYRWLGWVTLLPLFLSIRVLSPGWAWCAGSLWGFCVCLFASSGGATVVEASFRSFSLLTIVPGLYALFGVLITRRVGFSPLLLGLGWLVVELALQPLALHRGLLASTQGDGLVVRTLGNLAGYFLVAFLVAYVNATLLIILDDACTVVGASSRMVVPSSAVSRRWFCTQAPAYLVHPLLPLRPRAPPR